MSTGFSEKNSHPENMRISASQILGVPASLRRVKKVKENHQKNVFIKVIEHLMFCEARGLELAGEFDLPMKEYELPFYEIIDSLLELQFNPSQISFINFFIYERLKGDEVIMDYIDEQGNVIPMSTPEDLWNIIQKYK